MAKITSIIPVQMFEIIRDRIAEILASEFANQFILSSDPNINASVWVERFVPFDKTDMPSINVALNRGDYSNKDMTAVDGAYRYNIDCYASHPDTSTGQGDSKASIILQRIIGMCRFILESTQYKTLGYAPPFNCRVAVRSIAIYDPINNQDATHQAQGRIEFTVTAPERSDMLPAVPITGNDTGVKLHTTDKGYVYKLS